MFFAAGMVAYGTHEIHEYIEEREHAEAEAVVETTLTDAPLFRYEQSNFL